MDTYEHLRSGFSTYFRDLNSYDRPNVMAKLKNDLAQLQSGNDIATVLEGWAAKGIVKKELVGHLTANKDSWVEQVCGDLKAAIDEQV